MGSGARALCSLGLRSAGAVPVGGKEQRRSAPPRQAPAGAPTPLGPSPAHGPCSAPASPGVDENLHQGAAEQDDAGAAEGGPALLFLLHRVAGFHLGVHEPHGQEEGVPLLHSAQKQASETRVPRASACRKGQSE